MKKIFGAALAALMLFGVAACSEAATVSTNISQDADNFKILRRVVFYNGINGDYILSIEGYCSLNYDVDHDLTVTCKIGENAYKKHFLAISDNVTYFSEQLDAANVSPNHYKVIFRPETIIPDIEIK